MSIDPGKVKKAVYARIDFPLPESTWEAIDHAFGDCWNNVIGIGGDIYFDQIFDFVNGHLKKRHILLLPDNLARVLTIMLDHIEMIGGFLDDPRCPNNPDNETRKQKEADEMTARIRKASEAGTREVEEMRKHPLAEEEVRRAVEKARESQRLSRKLTLLTDRDTDTVYLSAWLAKDHPKEYAAIAAALDRHGVRHDLLPHTADYWCRDYMPVQSRLDRFVGYVYRPDYLDNARDRRYITDPAPVCRSLGIAPEPLPLVLDGGNIVKCPETVIMTEKVFAENPDHTPARITAMLEKAFQAEILYLPWDPAEPYGHADGVVRHIRGNRVLFTNYRDFDPAIADEMLRRLSARFRVIELRYDVPEHHPDSWAYINYLQTSRVILLPALGIPEDAQALEQILRLFPDYSGRVEQIPLASLVRQGGALNCLTWNIRTAPFES